MSTIAGKPESVGSTMWTGTKGMLDSFAPPEQRAEWMARLQAYTIKHPKVMSFLLTNIALTGGPLALFVLFAVTIFVFPLIVALVVGLLIAVVFTLFWVGVALCVLLPVVFFTTLTACFLFLTALGGYYAITWLNNNNMGLPTAQGNALSDHISALTGGKLDWAMGQVRQGKEEQTLGPTQARNTPVEGHGPKKLNRKPDEATTRERRDSTQATEKDGTTALVASGVDSTKGAADMTNAMDGAGKSSVAAGNVTGTLEGGASVATGLT